MRKPIITLDGPAGAGKSSVARQVARSLGLRFLDTGAMYRAVTWKARKLGLTDPVQIAAMIHCLPYIGFPRALSAISAINQLPAPD